MSLGDSTADTCSARLGISRVTSLRMQTLSLRRRNCRAIAAHLRCPRPDRERRAPEIAKATWSHRKERTEDEQRRLKARLIEQQGLNKQAITARVQGKISEEDFNVMKQSITDETKLLEHSLLTLEQERATLNELMETTGIRLQNLSRWYQSAGLQEKIELAFSLFPDGLRWSEDSSFLNTGNRSIFQMVEAMVGELEGVGGRPRT